MKFTEEKKQAVIQYILEKVEQREPCVSRKVSETFEINQNTVHRYITELLQQGVLVRIKRGEYQLAQKVYDYTLSRDQGELESDTYPYQLCLSDLLQTDPQNVREIWAYAFSEMMNNVIDHSQAATAHIRILRNPVNTTAIIRDNGVGIFRKIQEYFHFESLDDAICELFKGKLTTDSANHSGEGIFFSSRMMDCFVILSEGKVFSTDKYDNSVIRDVGETSSHGTVIYMTLSNTTNKTAREVFDSFADVDGGFTKTSIPMKNIFENSPVSRSQAKRLYNRLDCFEEVTLDFDGLEWMGQAFAHQLFVVFRREHPNIRLNAENMNDAVAKMYHHVLESYQRKTVI